MTPHVRELEETITRLAPVDAARVVVEGDRIVEIHVVAAPGKPVKQIVRDIQSLAMARFGTPIDRRVVSVVQLAPDELTPATPDRPAVVAVDERANGSRTAVEVTLSYGDRRHVGTAEGPAVASARLRLVGEATLAAVESAFETAGPLALDSIGVMPVGTHRIVVAVVIGTGPDGAERLTVGSARSVGDDDQAGVRAVLDALNRRLLER